jgi:hypothetical protein
MTVIGQTKPSLAKAFAVLERLLSVETATINHILRSELFPSTPLLFIDIPQHLEIIQRHFFLTWEKTRGE